MIEKYTSDNILARLQAGESVDAIARELTSALNDANDKFQKAKADREKEQKARKRKIDCVDGILTCVLNLLHEYGVDAEVMDEIDNINSADIVDELDKALPAFQEYQKLMTAAAASNKTAPARSADPIEDFLNKFVR